MRRLALAALAGLLGGVLISGIAVWTLLPSMMLSVHPSRFPFTETVATLQETAAARGWAVPKVYNIQKSLQNAGFADMTPVQILSICQPAQAHRVLREDRNKRVTAVMPCRIGVYEAADGRTYVASMNIGLLGRMFGGTVAEVMGKVAEDEAQILASVVEP